jgi:short-subunit dehydrogenase
MALMAVTEVLREIPSKLRGAKIPASGKAVVTGAGGGLGQAFCRLLGARGYEPVPVDIKGTERVLDVTDPEACRELAREVEPVIWINNAGLLGNGDALKQSDEEIRKVVEVNVLGVIYGTRAAAEVMVASGAGGILNIGSLAAWSPIPGLAVYSASKHAVRAYTNSVAIELANTGVRCCVICPDAIITPMMDAALDDPDASWAFSGSRLLDPDEVATAGLELLLERGSLVRSLPEWRGALTKFSGLFPASGLLLGGVVARRGRAIQRRTQRSGIQETESVATRGLRHRASQGISRAASQGASRSAREGASRSAPEGVGARIEAGIWPEIPSKPESSSPGEATS